MHSLQHFAARSQPRRFLTARNIIKAIETLGQDGLHAPRPEAKPKRTKTMASAALLLSPQSEQSRERARTALTPRRPNLQLAAGGHKSPALPVMLMFERLRHHRHGTRMRTFAGSDTHGSRKKL